MSTDAPVAPASSKWAGRAARLGRVVVALFLFVGALQLMKTAAGGLSILQEDGPLVQSAASTLGLGWLGALLVLSGSPIAASALTLVASREDGAGGLTEIQGFTMLTGSRLGAAFVVLVTAVVYAFRAGKGGRKDPLAVAVMCLFMTAIIYVPAAFLGIALLRWDTFHGLNLYVPGQFIDLIDLVYGDLVEHAKGWPAPLVFLGGLAVLLVSFRILDTVLPTLDEETIGARRAAWLGRKWPMFAIGSAVALVTMSVSVALAALVPLVAKRYVDRGAVIPYIMGANITTLGDTMFAAFALGSPAAVRIVVAEVIAITALSVLLLAFFYPQLQVAAYEFQHRVTTSLFRLGAFTAALFAIPVLVIVVAAFV